MLRSQVLHPLHIRVALIVNIQLHVQMQIQVVEELTKATSTMTSWLEEHRQHYDGLIKVGGAIMPLLRQRFAAHLPQPVRDKQLHSSQQELSDRRFERAIQSPHHLETDLDLDQVHQFLQRHLAELKLLQY